MLSEGCDTQLTEPPALHSCPKRPEFSPATQHTSHGESTCDFVSVFRGAREGSAIMTKTFRRLPEENGRGSVIDRRVPSTSVSLYIFLALLAAFSLPSHYMPFGPYALLTRMPVLRKAGE